MLLEMQFNLLTTFHKQRLKAIIHGAHIKCMRLRNLHRGQGRTLEDGGATSTRRLRDRSGWTMRKRCTGHRDTKLCATRFVTARLETCASKQGLRISLAQSGTSRPKLPIQTRPPRRGGRPRAHGEIRRPIRDSTPELRHSSLSLCNHSPGTWTNRVENYSWQRVATPHTDLIDEMVGARSRRGDGWRIPWPSWSPPRVLSLARLLLLRRRRRRVHDRGGEWEDGGG